MSGSLSRSAHAWLSGNLDRVDAEVSIVDGGIAVTRRTGVSHHIADAAELTVDGETVLAARWLCGGQSVDAVMISAEGAPPACIGCRLAAAVPQCPVVYFAWGEGDELLYVGSSINAAQRLRAHHTGSDWWPEVKRLTFTECASEFEARRREAEEISTRPGVHNKAGRFDRQSTLSLLDNIEIGEQA